jgi:hypothetical protein
MLLKKSYPARARARGSYHHRKFCARSRDDAGAKPQNPETLKTSVGVQYPLAPVMLARVPSTGQKADEDSSPIQRSEFYVMMKKVTDKYNQDKVKYGDEVAAEVRRVRHEWIVFIHE